MQLSREIYARKRIHNGSVQIENSVTWDKYSQYHEAWTYRHDGIFSQHFTTIKDSPPVTVHMSFSK